MSKKFIPIVLGLMCFALTYSICIQMKTVKTLNTTVGQSYEENNLRAQVLKMKEKYENRQADLEKATELLEKERQNATQNNSSLEEMERQIKEGNKLIGMTDVTGPGVIITLKDSTINPATVLDVSSPLVHDTDVLSIIGELKNAGAEAISINDERLVTTTAISCGGNIIDINKSKVGAPFVIKAIGLPEYLDAISRPGGYFERLEDDGIIPELKKSNKITINKYSGAINFKYAKNVE